MGKRICKSWNTSGESVPAGLFLGLFFLGGGLLACLLFGVCGEAGGKSLSEYLTDYLCVAQNGTISRRLDAAIWSELRYGLFSVLMWWTAFRVVGYSLLFAVRGFFLAFSVGAFVYVFGLGGMFPACVLFFLPALCWAPALFFLGIQGLCRTRRQTQRVDATRTGLRPEELRSLVLASILFLLSGVLQAVIIPQLLPFVARIVL